MEKRAYISHLGVIFSNLSIALLLSSIVALLSSIIGVLIPILILFLWGAAVLFTIGLLLINDTFRTFPLSVFDAMDTLGELSGRLFVAAPYLLAAGFVLSILSAVLLAFEPSANKHYGRIGITCSIIGITLFVIVAVVITLLREGGAA